MMTIPHPQRVLFPQAGVTRLMLARYYAQVAPAMLPHLAGRALTLRRWPHGLEDRAFYQKHLPPGPIVVETAEELVRWIGLGTIEFHAPLGRLAAPDCHDWAVMDLDPNPPAGWEQVREVATAVAWLLDRLRLPFRLKTSGAAGVHFYLPVQPLPSSQATACMEAIARVVALAMPAVATLERRVAERGPRVYLDYLQNGGRRTMAAVYSVRATPTASVSAPITLAELCHPPQHWSLKRVAERVAQEGDRFAWSGPRPDLPARLREAGMVIAAER